MTPNKKSIFGPIRTLGISAPAGPCSNSQLDAALQLLHSCGVNTVVGKNVFRNRSYSYLSADDPARAEDFNLMLANEQIDAILCTRGGYGTPRILEQIDYDLLRKRNLPVIGFSDITALHLAMLSGNAGICIASQMAVRLPDAFRNRKTLAGIKRVYDSLQKTDGVFQSYGKRLKCLSSGNREISGGVIPLNMSLAAALCGTGFLPSMEGKIIVLEDIGEPVRKIDRMFYQLLYTGFFSGAEAVVFGQFSDCDPFRECNALFREIAERISCPVFTGMEYGHELPSLSFRFNEPCRIVDGYFQVRF